MSKQPGVGSPENKQTPQIVPFPTPEHPARETAPSRRTMARWLIWAGAAVVLIAGAVGVWWSMAAISPEPYAISP